MTPALATGSVIAVLGAESTGKTELARALAARLQQRGITTTLVGEYLREWCEREGRTPRPDEQAAIAAKQTRRIAEAARRGVVVAVRHGWRSRSGRGRLPERALGQLPDPVRCGDLDR